MSRRIAIWIFVVVVFVGAVAAASNSTDSGTSIETPLRKNGVSYSVKKIQSSKSKRVVAIIPIVGAITNGDSASNGSTTGAADVERMIDAIIANKKRFDGVILELDTPGGAVLAAQEIHAEIMRLKKETDLPVVAWMRDMAASAGYYISAPADRIVAASTTFTGSIGVIMEFYEAQKLADKVGVSSVVIKSGKLKDMGNPLRKLTPEERDVLQSIIDEAYGEFVGVVADGRHLPKDEVRKLADGRVYSGVQAKDLGLVDELGLRSTAYDAMAKLLAKSGDGSKKGSELNVVEVSRSFGVFESLATSSTTTLDGVRSLVSLGSLMQGKTPGYSASSASQGNGMVSLQYKAELG